MIQLVKLNIKCLLSISYTSTCYLLLDTAVTFLHMLEVSHFQKPYYSFLPGDDT